MSLSIHEEFKDLGRMVATRWARRRRRGTPLRNLTLSLTYRCNAKCEMCYVWKKDTQQEKHLEMSLEQIERLAASPYLQKLVALGLTGGETFLYENLSEVIKLFHKYSPPKYISLSTNGFLPDRTEEMLSKILERFPTELWVSVSLDAMDEQHNQIRGIPKALELSKATLERLVGLRNRYSHLGVGILFTLQPHNCEQLVPIYRYAESKKVQFRWNPINYGEEYYERDPGQVMKEYQEVLPKIDKQFEILDREGHSDLFEREFRALFRPYIGPGSHPVIPCFAAVASAFINPYGDVFPCVPARKDFLMGNLKEQDFDSIWESTQATEIRNRIKQGICRCLITCETSTALRYSTKYQIKRILHGLFSRKNK